MPTKNKIIPVFTLGYQLNENGEAEIMCDYHEPPVDDVNSEVLNKITVMATISFVPEWLGSEDPGMRQAGLELLNELMTKVTQGD